MVKLDKEIFKALAWIATQYRSLQNLDFALRHIEQDSSIEDEERDYLKLRTAHRLLRRAEPKTEKHLKLVIAGIEEHPELLSLEPEISVPKNELVKAFSFFSGQFKDELETVRQQIVLKMYLLRKKKPVEAEAAEQRLKEIVRDIETKVAILVTWTRGLDAALQKLRQKEVDLKKEGVDLGRRQFLKVASGSAALPAVHSAAKAAGFLAGVFSFLGKSFAAERLRVRYVKYEGKVALALPVRKEMTYSLVAKRATEKESNWPRIEKFNGKKKLKVGDTVYVEREILSSLLRKIFDENKFEVFTLDDEGSSLAEVMETNCDYKSNGYNETLNTLLIINDDINLAEPVMYENQKIIIPKSLISKEIIRDEPPPKPPVIPPPPKEEKPKPKPPERTPSGEDKLIARMAVYQNPYRISESAAWASVIPNGRWGVARIRDGRISGKPHDGVDLPAAIGTPLYPIGVGRVTEIKDYQHPKVRFWRNGKVIRIKLATGYLITYCHMQKFRSGLKVNDVVDLDTVVGYVNTSGNCPKNQPHVHIGVKTSSGKIINPTPFIRLSTPEGQKLLAEFQASVRNNRSAYLKLFREVEQKALGR
ncbi:M23 family metallopeptidase [Candidatus Woesearchaeota archaeon]|nr:M23 family metallopeptidase [Candidatus Woesearchaeota archaeon]